MVTIKISLDKRKVKKDNTYPICFRIYQGGTSTTKSSKIDIKEEHWNDEKKCIRKSHPNASTLNKLLLKKVAELHTTLLTGKIENLPSTSNLNTAQKQINTKRVTVYEFANSLIKELKLDNRIGNAWVYEATVSALIKYHPDEKLYFEQLDYNFLDKYNKHLLRSGAKLNTAFLYLRTLRAMYNKAIKHKIVDRTLYPFHDISLKGERTRKRAIDKLLIKKIVDLELPNGSSIWHVRNWFMLSFYLIGISIVDLALLSQENIKNGRIIYKRQKTGKVYDIKLIPQAVKIIKGYEHIGLYLLPIINRNTKTDEERLRLIKDRTRFANKYLKQIAALISASETITTYTARHSWATICKKLGFSIEIIAEALGHDYGNKTTAVYLDSFDQDIIDNANQQVVSSINHEAMNF